MVFSINSHAGEEKKRSSSLKNVEEKEEEEKWSRVATEL